MTTKWHWLTILLLACGLFTTATVLPTAADDKKDAPKPEPATAESVAPDPVLELAANAYKTAEFGRENKSPEALVAAALMLRKLTFNKKTAITEQPTDENGTPIADKSLEEKSFADEATDLFDEASLLALQLKIMGFDAVIESAKNREVSRGPAGGPKTIHRKLGAGKTEVFHLKFKDEEPAHFHFRASEPLHLHVVRTDYHHVWVDVVSRSYENHHPGRAGGKKGQLAPVTITIHNRGKKPAEYTLFMK
jgi:hypothetical protein